MAYYGGSGMLVTEKRLKQRLAPYENNKRKELLMTESFAKYAELRAKAKGMTFNEYVRSLISEDMKKAL